MKELSIIIPHYKESEKAVFPLLSSISNQVGVDFSEMEIIIVTDGGGYHLNEDFFELFRPIEIKQIIMNENRGPGIARQTGIDAAKGMYLMFCDADDILHNVGVLGAMLQEVETHAPDILTTQWIEEIKTPEGGYVYSTHEGEMTWMHGKMLRKEYLREIGVRHHESLRVHEDSYYLSIAAAFTARRVNLPVVSYVWRWRDESITRNKNYAYTYNSFPTFIYAICESYRAIEQADPSLMLYRVTQFVIYVFFDLQCAEWAEYPDSFAESENAFQRNIAPYWQYFDRNPEPEIARIYEEERRKNFSNRIENETFADWLRRMRNVDKEEICA